MFAEPTEVVIGFGDEAKTFEITPLVRKKYKKFFGMIGDIIQEFLDDEQEGKEAIDLDNIEQQIPLIIQTIGDKIGEIYVFILDGVDLDWIENNMTFDQEIELISAIFEQNDIERIVKNFKKMADKLGVMKSLKSLSSKKSVQNTQ